MAERRTRRIGDLRVDEVLAVAAAVERANGARMRAFASFYRGLDGEVAARFEDLAREEQAHEALLVAAWRERYDGEVPEGPEVDVQGVVEAMDLDDAEHAIFATLAPRRVYELALAAERGAQGFYRRAAREAADPVLAKLMADLAGMEDGHVAWVQDRLHALGVVP